MEVKLPVLVRSQVQLGNEEVRAQSINPPPYAVATKSTPSDLRTASPAPLRSSGSSFPSFTWERTSQRSFTSRSKSAQFRHLEIRALTPPSRLLLSGSETSGTSSFPSATWERGGGAPFGLHCATDLAQTPPSHLGCRFPKFPKPLPNFYERAERHPGSSQV
jgi:hypothetical protein